LSRFDFPDPALGFGFDLLVLWLLFPEARRDVEGFFFNQAKPEVDALFQVCMGTAA
jgi:hypothetical protein